MGSPADTAKKYMEAWNRRDWKTYRELLDNGYTYTGGDGEVQRGPEAGLAVGQMFATAFPDGVINVREVHTAGDTAIVEFSGIGTHSGDLMGISPTGRHINMPVITVLTTRGGKIVSEREYMDMAHLMRQLGVMPAAATV
jgi:steroid delta-isomerase-like uncharacterized protein